MSQHPRHTEVLTDAHGDARRSVAHPGYAGLIGIARRDITPPVGIHNRMWAAASESTASGVHRPLFATALSMRSSASDPPLILVSLDLGWWRSPADERALRDPVLEHFAIDDAQLMLHLTHTHAGPAISLSSNDKPGGELIEPYLDRVRESVIEAIAESIDTARSACIEWTAGRCDLATNRMFPDPDSGDVLVGFNPDEPADDTLLVGRIVDEAGEVFGTLINYACHPTSLGPGNRLISPDYIGAAREVVEQATSGAPCLFMQGASADLGPRDGFASDPAVADRNGRRLGHAAVGAFEGMLPPKQQLVFADKLVSGAALAMWEPEHRSVDASQSFEKTRINLPLRQLAPALELASQLESCADPVMSERLERAYRLRVAMDASDDLVMHIWIWRVGEIVFIGLPAEAHSSLQIELRNRFPSRAIVVTNVVNGYLSYLPRCDEYRAGSYQADVALYESGCLERVVEACSDAIGTSAEPLAEEQV